MSLASSPSRSLWLTVPAAGLVLGVSSFCALKLLEPAPPPAQPAEAAEPPPPLPQPLGVLAPAGDDDGGCQIVARASVEGAPREDARFELHLVGQHGSKARWEAAPHEGAHRFVSLPEGSYHLTGSLAGHGLEATRFACGGDGERAFFDLAFEPAKAVLSGRVTGRDDAAVDGTELLLEQPHGRRDAFGGVAHVPLDAEGRFSVELAPGRYSLLAVAPHHSPRLQELTLEEGEGETRLKLPWRPEARGVVTDAAGEPLAGATVSLGPSFDPKVPPSTVTTDDEGRFAIPVLPGRASMLSARSGSLVGLARLPAVSATKGPTAGHENVTLQLEEGRTVSGWVEQRDTRPCAFCDVAFRVKALGLAGSVKAKEDGSFELPGMPRRADVELWPRDGAIGAWGGQVATPERSRVLLTYVPPAY